MPFVVLPWRYLLSTLVMNKPRWSVDAAPIAAILILTFMTVSRSQHEEAPFMLLLLSTENLFKSV